MARILVTAGELRSGALAAAEMSRRLEAAGHRVAVAAPPATLPILADAASEAHELPSLPLNPFSSGLPPPGLRGRLPAARRRRLDAARARLGAGALAPILDAVRPDLSLIDFELHAPIIDSLAGRWRTALFTTMLAGLPGLRSPPLNADATPGEGARGSPAAVGLLWARLWLWKRRRALRLGWTEGGADVRSALRDHARRAGVRLADHVTPWRFQYPWAWRLPLLVQQAAELEAPARPRPEVRHVGPMISRAQIEAEAAQLAQAPWARRAAGRTGPLVYAAFGALIPPPARLIAGLLETARRDPSMTLVIGGGGRGAPEQASAPPNVVALDWAPQSAILARADICVCHAGTNTIAECVDADAALLVYPSPHVDHRGNAARVAFHGIGHRGRDDDGPDEVAARLRAALQDRETAARRRRMREAFARYEREGAVEREVARLLESDGAA